MHICKKFRLSLLLEREGERERDSVCVFVIERKRGAERDGERNIDIL